MLLKTLKYDLAYWKRWCVFSGLALLLAVITGLCVRSLLWNNGAPKVLEVIVVILAVILYSAYIILSISTPTKRFRDNFFTDEAYLTFTLPVKRSTLVFSKFLSALIWLIASLVILLISLIIIGAMIPSARYGTQLGYYFTQLSTDISESFILYGAWEFFYILNDIVSSVSSIVFLIVVIFFITTVEQQSTAQGKKKVKGGFLVFLIIVVFGIISGFIGTFIDEALYDLAYVTDNYGYNIFLPINYLIEIAYMMAEMIISAFLYKSIVRRVTYGLNLA